MVKFAEMDAHVSLNQQLDETGGPVILINKFDVDPAEADQLLKAWEEDANYFKRQPGFISTQLHRGIAGSGVFLNYAVWESVEHYKPAFRSREFQAMIGKYPQSTVVSPQRSRTSASTNRTGLRPKAYRWGPLHLSRQWLPFHFLCNV
jgi:heme-degrading monooxygenase HmoA